MREVSRSDGGREQLPLSHAVRVTAPLTRGAFQVRYRKGERYMKATGIVRRVDDLGRIVIPKEIRRTLKIREGDPSYTTLTPIDRFIYGILKLSERLNFT